jgi:hypothetical protein
MKKIILILFVFAIAFTSDIFAQSGKISGKVTDKKTGEPLPGVNIIMK